MFFRSLFVVLVMCYGSVAFAQQRSSVCCNARDYQPLRVYEAERTVRPGVKTHVAIGAVAGGAIALLLNEIIEGDNVDGIAPLGVVLGVPIGMVAGGLIGWIVYKIRQ